MTTSTLAAAIAITPMFFTNTAATSADLTLGDKARQLMVARRLPREKGNPIEVAVTRTGAQIGYSISQDSGAELDLLREFERKLASVRTTLEEFVDLPDDWDDLGAAAPDEAAASYATDFLESIGPFGNRLPTRIYPSPSGEIGLVWDRHEAFADLTFAADGTINFYLKSATGEEVLSDGPTSLLDLSDEFWTILKTI
jgi:hypothetical protein